MRLVVFGAVCAVLLAIIAGLVYVTRLQAMMLAIEPAETTTVYVSEPGCYEVECVNRRGRQIPMLILDSPSLVDFTRIWCTLEDEAAMQVYGAANCSVIRLED